MTEQLAVALCGPLVSVLAPSLAHLLPSNLHLTTRTSLPLHQLLYLPTILAPQTKVCARHLFSVPPDKPELLKPRILLNDLPLLLDCELHWELGTCCIHFMIPNTQCGR